MQYVTLERAKLNPSLANVDDSLLTILIKSASAVVYKYCNNDFTAQTYTDTVNGKGLSFLYLHNMYQDALVSVKQRVSGSASFAEIDKTLITIDSTTGMLYYIGNADAFERGLQNYEVSYTVTQAVPEDVQEAVVQMMYATNASNNSTLNPELKSEKMGEHSWTRADGGNSSSSGSLGTAGILPGTKALLDPYRRYVIL